MRKFAALLGTLLVLCIPGGTLAAQTVYGLLVEEGSGQTVAGGIVTLVGSNGAVRAGTLTDAGGRFRLVAPEPGRYRLRAERIGFESVTSEAFELAAGTSMERRVATSATAISLEGMTVTASRRCVARPDRGAEMNRLWDEARKALYAAALTEDLGHVAFRTTIYERDMDLRSSRVERESVQGRLVLNNYPFRSPPAAELIERGFVRVEADTVLYFAPDAHVLLSDEFLDSHCFHVQRRGAERGGLIGLGFEPVPDRRARPGVRGVLWVDEQSSELSHIEYRYTRLPIAAPADRFGGRLDLERIPGGGWIVRDWVIRMPLHRVVLRADGGTLDVSLRERGGTVQAVQHSSNAGRLNAHTGVVHGVVWDWEGGMPIVGASLYLSGTSREALTGSDGSFRIDSVPPGVHLLAGYHPELDPDGQLIQPFEIAIAADAERYLELGFTHLTERLAGGCGVRVPGRASVVGVVLDEITGLVVPGASLELVPDRAGEAPIRATADDGGRFRLCDVPAGTGYTLLVGFDSQNAAPLEVALQSGETRRLDPGIALSGLATLTGRVVDAATGAPVGSVSIRLQGSDVSVIAGASGEFRMADIPPGEHRFTVSHVAYGTHVASARVRGSGVNRWTVRLASGSIAIVGAVPASPTSTAAVDFDRRRRQSLVGTFITSADLEGSTAETVRELLQTADLVGFADGDHPSGGNGTATTDVHPCVPDVFLDGVLLPGRSQVRDQLNTVRPSEVHGIEIYRESTRVPPELARGTSACEVVAIWTRGEAW